MRNIKHIVVHSTATTPLLTRESILHLWKGDNGKRTPQFHYLILRDGEILQLHSEKKLVAGDKGSKNAAIHIAYAGGINEIGITCDNSTAKQRDSLFDKIVTLFEKYPDAKIVGADELQADAITSPGFNIKEWLSAYLPYLPETEFVVEPDYNLEMAA
jgi:N-acetylmuramoyl-L-alanine amidase